MRGKEELKVALCYRLCNCMDIGAIHWEEQKKLGIDFRFRHVGLEVAVE